MTAPYTDEDVDCGTAAFWCAEYRHPGESWAALSEHDRDSYRRVVRTILDDLVARGRLRQSGDRPEWEVLREAAAEMRRRGDAYPDAAEYGRGLAASADDLEAFAAEAESRVGEATVSTDPTPEPACPECATGPAHSDPRLPHVHLTSYGYLLYAPDHRMRDYIEEIRDFERRAGRESAARDTLLPPGGDTEEQWNVRDAYGRVNPDLIPCGDRRLIEGLVPDRFGGRLVRREVHTWNDGSTWVGPWTVVEETADG